MKILITGGAGYIGSHTLVEVIRAGHQVVVVDSLVNGHAEAIGRVGRLTNTDVQLAVGDIRDKPFLESVFTEPTKPPVALLIAAANPAATAVAVALVTV